MRIQYFLSIIVLLSTFSCQKKTKYPPLVVVAGEMIDARDGQHYRTVKIGAQTWMADNLNYYTPTSWYYDRDSITYSKPYGRLYMWSTAMDGHAATDNNPSNVQGISPAGWHIPSYAEWKELEDFIKKYNAEGDALKEAGKTHWKSDNNGTNTAMFNAVGAGSGSNYGYASYDIESQTAFVSTSLYHTNTDSFMLGPKLTNDNPINNLQLVLSQGWSIRCVQDK